MLNRLSTTKLLALTVAAIGAAAQAHAATIISVQYETNGTSYVGANTAGAVPATNYNTIGLAYVGTSQNGTTTGLKDSTNTATSVSVTTVSDGGYDHATGISSSESAGNQALYVKFALGNYGGIPSVTINLAGLTPTDTYSLYTYVGSSGSGDVISGTVGTQTYYLTTGTTTLTQSSATTPTTSSTAPANYFAFTGLVGATESFSLSQVAIPGDFLSLYGFQIVDNGPAGGGSPVPEPASLGLLGVGAVVMLRRRRSV